MDDKRTTIELTHAELELLAELLDRNFRDLKQEIGSTEGFEFREGLKARRDLLASLLDKVRASRP